MNKYILSYWELEEELNTCGFETIKSKEEILSDLKRLNRKSWSGEESEFTYLGHTFLNWEKATDFFVRLETLDEFFLRNLKP
jgi:uncharacterized protein (DUF2132 family)